MCIGSTSGGLNCTCRFATREAVEAAAADTLVNRDKQQRIIPNINFTCDGAITKWIVDGGWNDGGMRDWYPDLQIVLALTCSLKWETPHSGWKVAVTL